MATDPTPYAAATPAAPEDITDVDESEDDGWAVYDGSHMVDIATGEQFISALTVGDVFRENGAQWVVNDIERDGDDYRLDLERVDGS